MKVAFALMAHFSDDERVWFQQAETLRKAGCEVSVVSALGTRPANPHAHCYDAAALTRRQNIATAATLLAEISPEVIICDNPLAILAAQRSKKNAKHAPKIIYDITEWYPSKKNIATLSLPRRILKIALLTLLSAYAAWLADAFIFGEYYKSLPFRRIFFWKKHIFLPYYAPVDMIVARPAKDISKECTLCYSGSLTAEKGFPNVLETAIACAKHLPETQFILNVISNDAIKTLPTLPQNLKITHTPYLPFEDFCKEIGTSDIFLDLRQIDTENTRCLPIKLFYYMAAGRPVVYSDLKAIRKEVPEWEQIGTLVNPNHTDKTAATIAQWINNKETYQQQCAAALRCAQTKYNWENIAPKFVELVEEISS